jgi:hypothetical protein
LLATDLDDIKDRKVEVKTKPRHKHISWIQIITVLGLFSFASCLPLFFEIFSLSLYVGLPPNFGWPDIGLRQLLRLFYLPQLGVLTLIIVSVVNLGYAIKKYSLNKKSTYITLVMLILYCSVASVTSRVILDYSIRTKINNPDGRTWSDAMVGRSLYGYPTGATCNLSDQNDQVVALVREWSFITPDGNMPVLIWSENSLPNSKLLGSPKNCKQIQPDWYICYLSKPYQLILNDDVCG